MSICFFQFAYFKRILEREKKRRHAGDNSDGEENDASDAASDADEPMEEDTESQPSQKKKPVTAPKEAKRLKPDVTAVEGATGSDVTVTKEQLTKFQSSLFAIFEEKHVQQIPIDEVRKHVTAKTKLNDAEIMSCIEQMSSDNKIMLASDILYLI